MDKHRKSLGTDPIGFGGKAFWSVKETADYYGVGVSTIWRWDRNGDIPPSLKIGGRRLHRIADHIDNSE